MSLKKTAQLMLRPVVYANMNRGIFQLFGAVILMFELLVALTSVIAINRLARTPQQVFEGELFLGGFLLGGTLIAVGLIYLHRWAAVTASSLGVIWALALAVGLGHGEWQALIVGAPIVFGLLLPFYATIRYWSQLKPISEFKLTSSFRALRSSDLRHLE